MTKPHRQDDFEPLQREIQADEAALRSSFARTPQPDPRIVARIKATLRTEAQRAGRRRWLGRISAVAAALLVAAGAALYYRAGGTADSGTAPQASLDEFTASLPAVQLEDPAVQQLGDELQDLEQQAASTWDNAGPAERTEPSADSLTGASDESLAWASHESTWQIGSNG